MDVGATEDGKFFLELDLTEALYVTTCLGKGSYIKIAGIYLEPYSIIYNHMKDIGRIKDLQRMQERYNKWQKNSGPTPSPFKPS